MPVFKYFFWVTNKLNGVSVGRLPAITSRTSDLLDIKQTKINIRLLKWQEGSTDLTRVSPIRMCDGVKRERSGLLLIVVIRLEFNFQ